MSLTFVSSERVLMTRARSKEDEEAQLDADIDNLLSSDEEPDDSVMGSDEEDEDE